MSYADQLPEIKAQYREEMRAIDWAKARNAHKMHGIMCAEVRKAMLEDFYDRVRYGHAAGQNR